MAPLSSISNRTDMSSRTGLEAEAINRLTDGVQPPAMRETYVVAPPVTPPLTVERAPTFVAPWNHAYE